MMSHDVPAPERRCMSVDTPVLTAELVVDGAVPKQPEISPDGRWVAYAVAPTGRPGERRLSAVWIAAADGSLPPRQLTAGTAADSGPRWAPDSASLFFMSDRTGSAQLHRIRLRCGRSASALSAMTRSSGASNAATASCGCLTRLPASCTRQTTSAGVTS